MTNKIIDDIDLDFDARNHRELSPFLFFTEQSLNYFTQNSFQSYQTQDSSHTPFINRIIYELESPFFSDKYYGNDKEEINEYNKSVLTSLKDTLNTDNQDPSIEYQFGLPYEIVCSQMSSLKYFTSKLKKLLKRDLKQMPISTARFPHFQHQTTNYFFYDDLNSNDNDNDYFQQDETKLNEIFTLDTEKKDTEFLISLEKLNEFYNILYQHTKAFSLSPTFVISTLDNLNAILDSLFTKNENLLDENTIKNDFHFFNAFRKFLIETSNEEERMTKINYFKLIMLIKMRLYLIIQRMHDCLVILLQFIIMEQEQIIFEKEDDHFSFEKVFDESLPETKKRSKIIKNVSSDQILDFYFSSNGNNDFILTEEGVFKINEAEENQIKKENQILQKKCNKNNARITFDNGILYLLSVDEKIIYRTQISQPEEEIPKMKKENKRPDKKEEEKVDDENKKIKHINKKLREQQRKEKKRQRRNEQNEIEKFELNLENIKINISNEYPIISMNVYDNYVRILQRKSINDDKTTTFIFTNVDLTPNSRTNYDVIEAFEKIEKEEKICQTQIEIEINNNEKRKYKATNACFSKDFIFFSFEDSSFEQWMIFQNGKTNFNKHFISPFLLFPYSRYKMDNNLFFHILEPINNESTRVNKMYLTETKHYIRSESEIFLKYKYLQKVSDIVDNCSQFIINREISKKITTEEFYKIKESDNDDNEEEKKQKIQVQFVDPFLSTVSPEEMSCIIQSLTSISNKLEDIKTLFDELKDENLKHFLASLLIKMCGVNFLYGTVSYYSSKDQMSQGIINEFKKFKEFILGLFESTKNSDSNNYNLMIRESFIFTFTIAAKFLFLPDCFNELHEFMNKLFYFNESGHENEKRLFNSLSAFMFSYPSSLYFINNSIYNQLIEYEEVINLQELFSKSLFNIAFEKRFSEKVIKTELISSIDKYFQSLFQYMKYILLDESNTINKVEQLFSILFGFPIKNCFYSLMILKYVTEITPILYDRILKIPGVIESDQEFLKGYQNIQQQTVHKEIKVIESEHPYILSQEKTETAKSKKSNPRRWWRKSSNLIKDLGTIEFDFDVDFIYCFFDSRCEIPHGYFISISDYQDQINLCNKEFRLNNGYQFNNSKIKVKLLSQDECSDNRTNWGYKISFVGVSFDNPYYWISNTHLNFYNHFISFLTLLFHSSFQSTPFSKSEKEFNLILNDKIIQGIKFEDIDNYESSLNKEDQNKQKNSSKRTLTRGISRGISYDTEKDSLFDDNYKKSFLNDLLTANENNNTRGKQFLDLLYTKTAKQNRIRLNESTKSILEVERYLAACLFKQLGLINLCLKFINTTLSESNNNNNNESDVEVPSRLKSVWKMIYLLRKNLFFSYQKSKVVSKTNLNSLKFNFKLFSEEIKRKCILLLYSDPILKFKENGNLDNETIESTMKSIFHFVTSEIPLSNISDLIDIRRKRLSISTQSINYLNSFLDRELLFESSKLIFIREFNQYHNFSQYNGVTQIELDDFNKLYGSLTVRIVKKFYSNPSFSLICNHSFLNDSLFKHNDKESRNECAKIFIETLEKTKENKTFSREYTNFVIICILLSVAAENKNSEILDYAVNLLSLDDIDFQCKRLILTVIPVFYHLIPDNKKINDKSLLFSILSNNKNSPIIVRSLFYWLATSIINNNNDFDSNDFIMKVLKGIGQSFIGKSCLFIDDSFDSYSHRQVCEGMISFIRLLTNSRNETMMMIIHEILTNVITKVKFEGDKNKDELVISIGLFASIGQILSSFESERKIINDDGWKSIKTIIGYNTSYSTLRVYDDSNKKVQGGFSNAVLFDPKKVDLTDNEIENILKLHEVLSTSKYFTENQNYNDSISEIEIAENILITTFYSFLPVIMQNKNNASLLMNNKNLNRSLSLFEFATKLLPSNENTIVILSHYLEQAINSPLYQSDSLKTDFNRVDKSGNFRFMKTNFGEIIYSNETDKNDLIQTNYDHDNLFICTRPFNEDCKTYFEVKINKIGNNQIFIGFINSCEFKLNRAFGFGCTGHESGFSRKSHYLSKKTYQNGDILMQKEWLNETGNTLSDNEYSDNDEEVDEYDESNKDENENNDNSNHNFDIDAFLCHDQKLSKVVCEIYKKQSNLTEELLTKTIYCLYRIAIKMSDICEQEITHQIMEAKLIQISKNFEPDLTQINSKSSAENIMLHNIFWAPELFDFFNMNEKSDVYSYAVIIYLMFTGRYPFQEKNVTTIQRLVRSDRRDVIPDSVPPFIKELIEACWDHCPESRPSFKEIAESLRDPSNTIEGLDRDELETLIVNSENNNSSEKIEDNNNNNDNEKIEDNNNNSEKIEDNNNNNNDNEKIEDNNNNNNDSGGDDTKNCCINGNDGKIDNDANQNEKSVYSLSDGDRIGCFFANDYLYLTVNGKLTPYRLYHTSLESYVPIIYIDHDDIELEIVQNATIVDNNDDKFDFLNIEKVPEHYFESKDIKKPAKISSYYMNSGELKEKKHLIGQQVYITKTITNETKSKMETIEACTPYLYRFHENYGIIKEIKPIENNRFVTKLKVESYDNNTLSKTIINIDSRYIKGVKTNFFNLIENQTNTKLGFNNTFNLKYLPKNLQNSSDFKSIVNFVKSKTIKDNSKSIALIMTRYLVFILVDYLRFRKSPLIQDEGIESFEMDKILNGLVISIPTITSFRPKFNYEIEQDGSNNYIIFNNEEDENNNKNNSKHNDSNDDYFYKIPGFTKIYNKSFGLFFKLSEQFISSKFISKILQKSIEKAVSYQIIQCGSLYKEIPSSNKLESFCPLPNQFIYKSKIKYKKLDKNRIVGFIPILVDSIPGNLPSVKCGKRRLRKSSDQVTYIHFNVDDNIEMKWKYNIQEIMKMKFIQNKSFDEMNFKLKFGILMLSKNLPENLLNSSLGFIQIIFNVFQAFNRSEKFYDKHKDFLSQEFLEKFFSLAKKKDTLVCPFIQVIIVTLISRYGFSDSLFQDNADNATFIFGHQFDKLFKIEEFPSSTNELPLLFSIYFKLIQTRISELVSNDDRSSLFEKYEKLNKELFSISDVEVSKKEKKFLECIIYDDSNHWKRRYRFQDDDENKNNKKKNFRSFYLVYYYSYLLNSDGKLPYPMFLFINEWMMQHFGGFRTTASKKDINGFKAIKIDNDKEIVYKSQVFQNDCDLTCSYQLISIYNEDENADEDDETQEMLTDTLEYEENENENENETETNENEQIVNAENDGIGNENEQKEKETNEDEKLLKKDAQMTNAANDNSENVKNKEHQKEAYKVFIHQLNDDKQIEITNSESSVAVSFPLEILIVHKKGKSTKKTKLKMGDVYIVSFNPSEKDKKDCFVSNYDQIQKDFEDFVKLSEYDNELYDSHNKPSATSNENTTNNNSNNNNNDNESTSNNNNDNNNDNDNSSNINSMNDNSNNNDSTQISENCNDNNNNNLEDENIISNDSIIDIDNDNDDDDNELSTVDANADEDENPNANDYQIYEIEKIPTTLSVFIPSLPSSISSRIFSLRYSIITHYSLLIENMMTNYALSDDDRSSYSGTNWWSNSSSISSSNSRPSSQYLHQIIGPAYSMKTESKFRFINNILKNEKKEDCHLKLIFNRFEQQKFLNNIENRNENSSSISARPLFVQLMEQVDDNSISQLKVRGSPPFNVKLVGEGAIDGGGPSREIFSSLIIEMMNKNLGIFTFNPNRCHKIIETNQEDLIPNKEAKLSDDFTDDFVQLLSKRFTFAGALIACCIVSSIPQPMKLSSIVWDYLTRETVSIESIYEIDNNFKEFIENCEELEKCCSNSNLSEFEFKQRFNHTFEIQNSFDKLIEVQPSGSKIIVTKENLHEFIQLAKKTRLHEFDRELTELKEGFDKIMSYKNITSILHPNELKLLVCGEPNCSIEQMKKLTEVSAPSIVDANLSKKDLIKMFWNVMQKFSPDERMQFIRFSTGNLGLPAPGLKWDKKLTVDISSRSEKEENGKKMLFGSTCASRVEIPFYETEDELEKMIRLSLKFSGIITDNEERLEEVSSEFL